MIWITKENQTLRINEDQLQKYLDEGYVLGRNISPNANKCWMNDGTNSLMVSKEEINTFLEKGYIKGFLSNRVDYTQPKAEDAYVFGKIWITKNKINKYVSEEELSVWLEQGWIRGKYQKPLSQPRKRRTKAEIQAGVK